VEVGALGSPLLVDVKRRTGPAAEAELGGAVEVVLRRGRGDVGHPLILVGAVTVTLG
jgi:hypothetical protein